MFLIIFNNLLPPAGIDCLVPVAKVIVVLVEVASGLNNEISRCASLTQNTSSAVVQRILDVSWNIYSALSTTLCTVTLIFYLNENSMLLAMLLLVHQLILQNQKLYLLQ